MLAEAAGRRAGPLHGRACWVPSTLWLGNSGCGQLPRPAKSEQGSFGCALGLSMLLHACFWCMHTTWHSLVNDTHTT